MVPVQAISAGDESVSLTPETWPEAPTPTRAFGGGGGGWAGEVCAKEGPGAAGVEKGRSGRRRHASNFRGLLLVNHRCGLGPLGLTRRSSAPLTAATSRPPAQPRSGAPAAAATGSLATATPRGPQRCHPRSGSAPQPAPDRSLRERQVVAGRRARASSVPTVPLHHGALRGCAREEAWDGRPTSGKRPTHGTRGLALGPASASSGLRCLKCICFLYP